ncbi:MAG: FAD-dependent oxidoreductase [Desulfamplus sp.]|nr:FAD-dependent oxidoreductase [Desulfamplus sp.]
MKFLIIGGDAAGMSAASRAKRNNPQMEVTVLEKTQDVSYSACGMPYNIADPLRDMNDLIVRKADVFRQKNGINLLTGHRVDKIDPVAKTVSGVIIPCSTSFSDLDNTNCTNSNQTESYQKFSYPFDKLLIATGATPLIPNIEGVNLEGVMPLKSLEHGRAIKSFINSNLYSKPVKKAVIIGMGYIGLEMCEALRARSIEVAMVKPSSRFLPWMVPQLADVVKQELDANGVKIYSGYDIQRVVQADKNENKKAQSNGGSPLAVICKNLSSSEDLTLDADIVIVASGVKPCSQLAVEAGLETGISGEISVDKALQTSDDNIYAAGDCADAFHVVTGTKCWIPLALRANRAGWAVADNVCGIETFLPGVAGTAVFKVFELQVARTGLTVKEALNSGFDAVEVVIQTRSKAHAHPGSQTIHVAISGDKKTGRLIGVQMVGKDGVAHRINAAAVALHAKMTVADFAQTDLAYAPPFGPVWDPLLTAANQLLKKL